MTHALLGPDALAKDSVIGSSILSSIQIVTDVIESGKVIVPPSTEQSKVHCSIAKKSSVSVMRLSQPVGASTVKMYSPGILMTESINVIDSPSQILCDSNLVGTSSRITFATTILSQPSAVINVSINEPGSVITNPLKSKLSSGQIDTSKETVMSSQTGGISSHNAVRVTAIEFDKSKHPLTAGSSKKGSTPIASSSKLRCQIKQLPSPRPVKSITFVVSILNI